MTQAWLSLVNDHSNSEHEQELCAIFLKQARVPMAINHHHHPGSTPRAPWEGTRVGPRPRSLMWESISQLVGVPLRFPSKEPEESGGSVVYL